MSDLATLYENIVSSIEKSQVKDDKFFYSETTGLSWGSPWENVFLSKQFSQKPMRDMARALWIYAGCRNLQVTSVLGTDQRPVPNPRYSYYSKDHDYIETAVSINNSFEEGDVFTIYSKCNDNNTNISWETGAQIFPSFTLSYSKERGGIHGFATFFGGDITTIFECVLPCIGMINRRMLSGMGETSFFIIFKNSRISKEIIKNYKKNKNLEKYRLAGEEWLSDLDTESLFSIFDDPEQLGGNRLMRRVLKPIILGGMAEANDEERIVDFVHQLPDSILKQQLLDFYGSA